jgi:glycosyltransferase involved in cell wall biosynthesis
LRAVIAGDGPDRERLAALARDLGVADRVELPGRIGDEALIALYETALAVFYAPFDEDYGYVTIEAFRAGRPVVTTADSGGVLEFVEDGVTGLVAPAEPREVAARLERLHRDRALAARLGRAGHARVESIDWDRVVDSLLAYA